jgi:transposase
MYIDIVPNRNSPPAVLLRESWREGKRTKKRTVANLSGLPMEAVEVLRQALKGVKLAPVDERFRIVRALPHGHVAAVLGTAQRIGVPEVLASRPSRERALALAMIVARILEPRSKLATARLLAEETQCSTLAEALGLEVKDENELYEALDWLLSRQSWIERKLAKRHLDEGALLLYDITLTYFEGRTCPLAKQGRPGRGKKGKLQILVGLICNAEGCPVAVEVFPGNWGDPNTLSSALEKVRSRFGVRRVVLVGDRGLLTEARIEEELSPQAAVDWITALRAPAIQQLVKQEVLQLSLFDERDLAEITSPDYPGERLIACRNPLLAEERSRKRTALLAATEAKLATIEEATGRSHRPLRGKAEIGVRVGKALERSKVGKHFRYEINEDSFTFERDEERVRREAALDGVYVIRTSVSAREMQAEEVVESYKALSRVEQAFRSFKTVDLKLRPIFHRRAERVRAHALLCMLAYYVEWHMRRDLAELLFDDHDPEAAAAARDSVVAPAQRSPAAKAKASTKRTEDGFPVHSFQTLLEDLKTATKNRVTVGETGIMFAQLAELTPLQERIFELLDVPYRA